MLPQLPSLITNRTHGGEHSLDHSHPGFLAGCGCCCANGGGSVTSVSRCTGFLICTCKACATCKIQTNYRGTVLAIVFTALQGTRVMELETRTGTVLIRGKPEGMKYQNYAANVLVQTDFRTRITDMRLFFAISWVLKRYSGTRLFRYLVLATVFRVLFHFAHKCDMLL